MFALLREFLTWWLGQLGELLPGWRRTTWRKNAALILVPDLAASPQAAAATARIEKRGVVRRLGRVSLDADGARILKNAAEPGFDIMIEMPAGTMLEKRLVLPLAAERDLERVLTYEMDRETPFAADEVYWGSEVEARDRRNRRITVRLAMVAKAQLAPLAAALGRAGLAPTALIGAGRGGVTIIPIEHDSNRRRGWQSIAVTAAAWAVVVLAIVAIGVPFLQQSMALDEVDAQIDSLRPAVQAVERLRDRIAGDRQQAEALAAQRAQFGDPLAMLAAVTNALPDDSHLTELDYSMGKLVLTGQSKAASHLIGDISSSPSLRDPAFSAPVMRVEQSKFDVFTITARMSP
jgi:general secretion pathway protein L